MKGLTGLVLQNKYTVTPLTVFFCLFSGSAHCFQEDWRLTADSNKLAAYSLWALWRYTSYRPGRSNNGVGVNTSDSRMLASLPIHVLDNEILNAIRQIVMDNNSGIH